MTYFISNCETCFVKFSVDVRSNEEKKFCLNGLLQKKVESGVSFEGLEERKEFYLIVKVIINKNQLFK